MRLQLKHLLLAVCLFLIGVSPPYLLGQDKSLTPVPRIQFLDVSGDPLAGGHVHTYISNTVTPQATYTDAGGGTPNANPVVFDSGGFAGIWLTVGESYTFAVHNSSDVLQWTVDAITSGTLDTNLVVGTTAVTFSATPTFDSSASVYFSMTLTGNVTSSTLSNAIDGRVVYFNICQDATGGRTFTWPSTVLTPPVIDSGISICTSASFVYDGTNWRELAAPSTAGTANSVRDCNSPKYTGANAGAKIIACLADLPSGGVADASGFQGAQTIPSTITISTNNVKLILGAATFTTSGRAFTVTGTNVTIESLPGASVVQNTSGNRLLRVENAATGFRLLGGIWDGNDLTLLGAGVIGILADDCLVEHTDIRDGTGFGLRLFGASNCIVKNNRLSGHVVSPIYISTATSRNARNNLITGNVVGTSSGGTTAAGVQAVTAHASQDVSGTRVIGNDIDVNNTVAFAIEIGEFGGATPDGIVVANNVIRVSGTSRGGISVGTIGGGVISGNSFDSGGNTISIGAIEVAVSTNVSVSGNRILQTSAAIYGIVLDQSSQCSVTGNVIDGFGNAANRAGIAIFSSTTSDARRNTIVGNQITFPSTTNAGVLYYGIFLQSNNAGADVSDNVISSNTVVGNGDTKVIGIHIQHDSGTLARTLVHGNNFRDLDIGINRETGQTGTALLWNVFNGVSSSFGGSAGSGEVVADLDLTNGHLLFNGVTRVTTLNPLEGRLSNTPRWIFKQVDFGDMTAGATADTFTLWTLPANTMVHDIVGTVVTGWSGGSISAAVCSVGTNAGAANDLTLDDNFFAAATVYELHDATASGGKGTLLFDSTDKFAPYMAVAAATIEIQCDLTGDNHANATAGQARVYALVSQPLGNTTTEAN